MSNLTDVTQRHILRTQILQVCNETIPLGASVQLLTAALKREGFPVVDKDVSDACNYLEQKGLVSKKPIKNTVLGINRDIIHITADGIDILEGTKQIDGLELG